MKFALFQSKMVQLPRNKKQTYRLNPGPQIWPSGLTLAMTCISEWEGRLTLNNEVGSRSFMTMTVTIWWPRSGERIYHIMTGVTSNVRVPLTCLVCTDFTCKIRQYEFGLQNTEIELCRFCHVKVLLPEQSLPVLGSKSVKICSILCLKTLKYLFNHQNIQFSIFHMWK